MLKPQVQELQVGFGCESFSGGVGPHTLRSIGSSNRSLTLVWPLSSESLAKRRLSSQCFVIIFGLCPIVGSHPALSTIRERLRRNGDRPFRPPAPPFPLGSGQAATQRLRKEVLDVMTRLEEQAVRISSCRARLDELECRPGE